jgi:hypothetical protein
MSKFLQNLLVQISKILVYSKIKFYSEKNFPHFRPSRSLFFPFQPAVPPPLPTGPRPLGRPSSPSRPNGHLLPPHRADRAPPLPPPGLHHRRNRGAMPPHLQPLNHSHYPPLNRSFMALKSPFTPPPVSPLMPAIIAAWHPPRAHIKGEPPPRSIPHHSPSLYPPLPHRNTPPTELHRHHHFTLVARYSAAPRAPVNPMVSPPYHSSPSQPPLVSTGKPERHPGRSPVVSCLLHRGPTRSCGPRSVDRVQRLFHCEINQKSQNSIFPSIFAKEPLSFFVINLQSLILQLGLWN